MPALIAQWKDMNKFKTEIIASTGLESRDKGELVPSLTLILRISMISNGDWIALREIELGDLVDMESLMKVELDLIKEILNPRQEKQVLDQSDSIF